MTGKRKNQEVGVLNVEQAKGDLTEAGTWQVSQGPQWAISILLYIFYVKLLECFEQENDMIQFIVYKDFLAIGRTDSRGKSWKREMSQV